MTTTLPAGAGVPGGAAGADGPAGTGVATGGTSPVAGPGPAAGRSALRARAVLATALSGGRTVLRTMRSDPPLTLRQTGPHTVHLVATAAGPLAGDRLELDIEVAPGTRLTIASVGGTLVLPGRTAEPSLLVVDARVGEGGSLRYAPEPAVLAAGCAHRTVTRLAVAEGGRAVWREELVFGRHGERPGSCHARFDATYAGAPLLRQDLVAGDPAVGDSAAVYGGARCVGSVLLAGHRAASTHLAGGCAVLPLAGPGTLVSALAADAPELRRRLAWGEAAAGDDQS
ncbi:urease accessory protein UreD [Sphaerisporangium rufum]|uniref:urease accessory protein UreD n=1 Tax=Sphaerisporangium rufum TaxID=1381558 RepID=UPI001EF359C2|nr:urease accessory protein UreD [Sphaerisporangium rufum]